MFLRNFYNYMTASLCLSSFTLSNYSNTTTELGDGKINIRCTDGAIQPVVFRQSYRTSGSASSSNTGVSVLSLSKAGICFGNGTTPVTFDDYRLSGDVINNALVLVSRGVTFDEDKHKYICELICTYPNSSSDDVIISEWGLWRVNSVDTIEDFYTFDSIVYSNNKSYIALMYREVLDEPIVIAAGTTATLTFTLEIPNFRSAI